MVLALIGLLGSLFIRPRRVWVRARREGGGTGTLVEVAALDRSGGGDVAAEWPSRGRPARLAADARRRSRDRRSVGDAQQPGGRGRGAGLLPGAARPPRRVGVAAQGAGRADGAASPSARAARRAVRASPTGATAPPDEAASGARSSSAGSASCSPCSRSRCTSWRWSGRGMAADPNRVPWGNMYEFTLAGTFVVAAALPRAATAGSAWPGWPRSSSAFVLTLLMVAVIWLYDPVAPLTEALNSYWLVIHVVSAIIATGAFTLGGISRRCTWSRTARRGPARPATSRGSPSPRCWTGSSYRLHAFGFPVWTFAVLITGPIWAHQAWSSYWNWDPKEVWAFITWVVYAAYLHARATAGWKGRNAAYPRAARRGHAVVQLHRDQLLLDHQPALLRLAPAVRRCRSCRSLRGAEEPSSARGSREVPPAVRRSGLGVLGVPALAVEVAQEVRVVVGGDRRRGAWGRRAGRLAGRWR